MSWNVELNRKIAAILETENYEEFLRMLRQHPQHLRSPRGEEQWMWGAAMDGNLPLIQALVELGVGVNEISHSCDPDDPGYQPEGAILQASGSGHLEVVRWLLDHGAKINYVVHGRPRCEALLRASRNDDHLDIVKLLVERGADIHADWNNMTAVTEAENYGAYDVRDYLISLGGKDIREIIPPDYPGTHRELLAMMKEQVGPVSKWRREIPGDPPVLLRHVAANELCEEYQTIFTLGLGDLVLSYDRTRFFAAEMRLQLAPDWPLDEESLKDPRWNWPLARFEELIKQVRSTATWFPGNVVWNGNPPQPLHAETEQCAWLFLQASSHWARDERVIILYDFFPLYEEEAKFVEREGSDELLPRFEEAGVPLFVAPHREQVVFE